MEKVIGIYRFYNKKNTIYVGQSVDCYKRLQKHRMNSWYKKDKWEIIKQCPANELCFWESYYIGKLKPLDNHPWAATGKNLVKMPNKRDYLDMSETVKSKDITFNWLSMSKSSEKKYLYDVETRYEKLANDFDNGKIKIIKYELNHNVGANKNKNVYVLDWKTKQCSKFKKMSDFNLWFSKTCKQKNIIWQRMICKLFNKM